MPRRVVADDHGHVMVVVVCRRCAAGRRQEYGETVVLMEMVVVVAAMHLLVALVCVVVVARMRAHRHHHLRTRRGDAFEREWKQKQATHSLQTMAQEYLKTFKCDARQQAHEPRTPKSSISSR